MTWRVTTDDGKLARMCVLGTAKNRFILTRALNIEDAELIKQEVTSFLKSSSL